MFKSHFLCTSIIYTIYFDFNTVKRDMKNCYIYCSDCWYSLQWLRVPIIYVLSKIGKM